MGSALIISRVFSYDTNIAHPYLTESIANLYNKNSDRKLSDEEVGWLRQGTVDEDIPIRWMNHFYDPQTGSGLWGFPSLKDWAQSPQIQATYVLAAGNQTWQKAIDSYAKGDERPAFIALGHILHLVEDATVPAHARLDAHPEGDPYEGWVKDNAAVEDASEISIVSFSHLSEAFDSIADYSNRYFFSVDTIDKNFIKNLKMKIISLDGKTVDCFLSQDKDGKEFCLVSGDRNFLNPKERVYYLTNINHSDYFSLLAPKAISYGAGVVKLFFEEGEKQRQIEQQKSWWEKFKDTINSFSFFSDILGPFEPSGQLASIMQNQSPQPSAEPSNASQPTPSPAPRQTPKSAPLPPGTVATQEKPAVSEDNAGAINEQTSPSDTEIPPPIIEEILPHQAILPSPNPSASPTPTPVSTTTPLGIGGDDSGSDEDEDSSAQSSATSTPVIPNVSIFLSGYNLTARQFSVNWQSSSTDISDYHIQTKQNSGDWQDWENATTSAGKIFVVPQDFTTYYFRAQTTNNVGTSSDWQEVAAEINFHPVAINEVAWAGTGASTTADEWLELYNKTDKKIILDGWSIAEGDIASSTNIVALKGQIAPGSYYLIERSDDGTVKDVEADLAKAWGGYGLANTGETLILKDSSGQEVDLINCSNGWLAGTSAPEYRTMEKVNPYLAADIPGNWQSNSTSTRNGLNAKGQPINGTPKAQNSIFNQSFFYLFEAQNTTATSTYLSWTPSFLPNLQEYKVIRSFGSSTSTEKVIASTNEISFFDGTLESETIYYYKIAACDDSGNCVESNKISTATREYEFSWAAPQIISGYSTTTPNDVIPNIVLGNDEQPAAIWCDYYYQRGELIRWIKFSKRNENGDWSEGQNISGDFVPSCSTLQIFKNGGDFEALYGGEMPREGELPGYEIFYVISDSDNWREPEMVSGGDGHNGAPAGTIDDLGARHIVWQGRNASTSVNAVFYRNLNQRGLPAKEIEKISGSGQGSFPNIIHDRQNKLHAFWYYCVVTDRTRCTKLLYSVDNQDGNGWSEPEIIYEIGLPGAYSVKPEVIADEDDNFWIAWGGDYYDINLIKFDGESVVQDYKFSHGSKYLNSPALIFNGRGQLYIFFSGREISNLIQGIYFTSLRENGQWLPTKTVWEGDRPARCARGVVDSQNNLHLVWQVGMWDYKIYYSWAKIE